MASRELVLDGSYGEGGGQVVRTALFFSVLAQRPVRVTKVRAGRPDGGLKPQHVGILELLADVCDARVEGAEKGATEFSFAPGRPAPGSYQYDIGTAGSIPLFLQTLVPVLLMTPGRTTLRIRGGTDVPFAPTIDWVRHVYAPRLAPLAQTLSIDVPLRGFMPAGGGDVRVEVATPFDEPPDADVFSQHVADRLGDDRSQQGRAVEAAGSSVAHAELEDASVAERQKKAARAPFLGAGLPTPEIQASYVESLSIGTSITLWLVDEHGNRLGADALGRKGRPAERVGAQAAEELLEDWAAGATVDRHLADHWVPWVALGAGAVRTPPPTGHVETNAWVVNRMLGRQAVAIDDGRIVPVRPTV